MDYNSLEEWEQRAEFLREQIRICSGIFPDLPRTLPKPVITRKQVYMQVVIESLYFESMPGVFVAGNLYYLLKYDAPMPAVLNPHGHWEHDRFERSELADIPSGCFNQARNGMVSFSYDMVGRGESRQFPHGFRKRELESYGISLLGLQLFHSIRCLDFLESLPFVDHTRIGCTGASGGGTQTFLLSAVDDRVCAAAPVDMVSFGKQGGCECENVSGLRIGTNNVEFTALTAPRPLLITGCTGDWTCHIPTQEYPMLKEIYDLYQKGANVAYYYCDAPHSYKKEVREYVCAWFLEQFFGTESREYLPEEAFFLQEVDLKVYDQRHTLQQKADLNAFAKCVKEMKKSECRTLMLTHRGREQIKKALQVLFCVEEIRENPKSYHGISETRLPCNLLAGTDTEILRQEIEGMDTNIHTVRVCSRYGERQIEREKKHFDVFHRSETAEMVGQIIRKAERLKEQGYGKITLYSEEDLIWESGIAFVLCPQIDACQIDPETIERKKGKYFYQPGFEGIGGIQTIKELMKEKRSE